MEQRTRRFAKRLLRPLLAGTLTALLHITAATATALEFQCELQGDSRFIMANIPGEEHLCDVTVKYEYSNETKRLWYAQNDSAYCSSRAYELRDKYIDELGYTCAEWPDRSGIDDLTPPQRVILDQRLKALIERGDSTPTPYRVTGVRATASTTRSDTPALLAFQFFFDRNTDYTEIIVVDDEAWEVMATLEDLKSEIDSEAALTSALIHSISDTGALHVHTTLTDNSQEECLGTQILSLSPVGELTSKAPHHIICHEKARKHASED